MMAITINFVCSKNENKELASPLQQQWMFKLWVSSISSVITKMIQTSERDSFNLLVTLWTERNWNMFWQVCEKINSPDIVSCGEIKLEMDKFTVVVTSWIDCVQLLRVHCNCNQKFDFLLFLCFTDLEHFFRNLISLIIIN